MKDLRQTADLSQADLIHLLELAEGFKRDPGLHHDALRGRVVVVCLARPSTLARLSFSAAIAQLGGTPVVVAPGDLGIGAREPNQETARLASRYAAALVMYGCTDVEVCTFAKCASIPVINAMTEDDHPCHSLADLLTIRECYGHFAGRKIAYVGRGTKTARSLLEGAAIAGMDISLASPREYALPLGVLRRAGQLAEVSGSHIEVTTDPHLAVKDADAVYTDAWRSTEDSELEHVRRDRALATCRVTTALMAEARPGARFLHGLPACRGDDVTAEVIDGPQSVVMDQADNFLPTAQAVLYALVNGDLGESKRAP